MTFEEKIDSMIALAQRGKWVEGRSDYWSLHVEDLDTSDEKRGFYKAAIEPGELRDFVDFADRNRTWSWTIDIEHTTNPWEAYSEGKTLVQAKREARAMLISVLPKWAKITRGQHALQRILTGGPARLSIILHAEAVQEAYGIPPAVARQTILGVFPEAYDCSIEIRPGTWEPYVVTASTEGCDDLRLAADACTVIDQCLREKAPRSSNIRKSATLLFAPTHH